jgi:ABC-type uncharacterized transport system permease subunit
MHRGNWHRQGTMAFMRPLLPTPASFARLQWFFPIAITAHNIEEAIWLPGFVAAHRTELPWTVAPVEFRFALVLLTAAAWVVTYLSWRTGPRTLWAHLLFGYIVAMLVNVVVPHIPAAVIFRGYAPGVVTAVLLNLPVLTLLSVRAIKDGYVTGRKAVAFAVGVPFGIVAALPALFALGRWLSGFVIAAAVVG